MSKHEQTYLPEELDRQLIAAIGHDPADKGFYVSSPSDSQVALPESLVSILRQAVQAMSEGLAVTVRPETSELTTSQVAELLGVTRPTVVKLLESGAIPFTRVGTHRRVELADVLRFRDSRRAAKHQFIAEMSIGDEPAEQPRRSADD